MDNNNWEESREERMYSRLQKLRSKTADCVDGILQMEMLSCDPQQNICTFRIQTQPWMKNGAGTLHGGMSATILDHSMGALLYCIKDSDAFSPTVEMQASYHRPLAPGKEILSRVRVVSRSKRLAHMAAELFQADNPEKVCASGTAIYFLTE